MRYFLAAKVSPYLGEFVTIDSDKHALCPSPSVPEKGDGHTSPLISHPEIVSLCRFSCLQINIPRKMDKAHLFFSVSTNPFQIAKFMTRRHSSQSLDASFLGKIATHDKTAQIFRAERESYYAISPLGSLGVLAMIVKS